MKKGFTICTVLLLMAFCSIAQATTWEAYVIRNATSGGGSPTIEPYSRDSAWMYFGIDEGGQKAGWGTNDMNGLTIGDIEAVSISLYETLTLSGYGPYLNIWVTDGYGNYAVLANEPSHTWEYTANGETTTDMTWDGSLSSATVWVYEVSGSFVLPDGTTISSNLGAGSNSGLTFADFANYIIATPTSNQGGSGAPDDLNATTYTAYGVNWIFGDTQDNYVDGYIVQNPTLVSSSSAVPEPSTIVLFSISLLGFAGISRKNK